MPAQTKSKGKYTLGQGRGGEALTDLVCPSGETCQVRRPGVQGLIKVGVLDSFDELTAVVKLEHFDRVDGKVGAAEVAELAKDPKKVQAGLELMQKVLVHCIVQPALAPLPPEPADCPRREEAGHGERCPACTRDPDTLYIDAVELEDQAFILQYCMGGVADLATFRAQRAELLGNLSGGQGLRDDAEQLPGDSGAAGSVLSGPGDRSVRPAARKRAGQGRGGR